MPLLPAKGYYLVNRQLYHEWRPLRDTILWIAVQLKLNELEGFLRHHLLKDNRKWGIFFD